MEIIDYKIIYDEFLHPSLKVSDKHEWSYMDDERIDEIDDIAWMLQETYGMGSLAEEYVFVVSLDATWRVKGVYQLAHGSSIRVHVGMRELFIFLLLTGADSFVIAHNHPDGELEESEADENLTQTIKECSELLDIEFLEHFIITRKGYNRIIENALVDFSQMLNNL